MSVIKCYLADPLYRAIQSCFYLSILVSVKVRAINKDVSHTQASNLVSVIVVAQAVDHLLAGFLGSTYSLTLYPDLSLQSFDSHTVTSMYSSSPGMPATFAISLGYVLTAACCIPLAQQTVIVHGFDLCVYVCVCVIPRADGRKYGHSIRLVSRFDRHSLGTVANGHGYPQQQQSSASPSALSLGPSSRLRTKTLWGAAQHLSSELLLCQRRSKLGQ